MHPSPHRDCMYSSYGVSSAAGAGAAAAGAGAAGAGEGVAIPLKNKVKNGAASTHNRPRHTKSSSMYAPEAWVGGIVLDTTANQKGRCVSVGLDPTC